MKKYEKFVIDNISNLKRPTIYFFLKNNGFSENFIKHLRNTTDSLILNKQPVNVRTLIKPRDTLEILCNPESKSDILECDGKLEILFEDDDYLIVNKPHNLACTPTKSHYTNNLGGQICKYMNSKTDNFVLRVINRLDKETAGIVAVAKSTLSYNQMKMQKVYYAICEGNLDKNFTINQPIQTLKINGINQHKRIVSPDGKPSVTHVFPIQNYKDKCLVKFELETGRTHQIRVHMAWTKHPLVGDCVYGKPLNHAFLLLKELSFKHFRTKQTINISVPFPEAWSALMF